MTNKIIALEHAYQAAIVERCKYEGIFIYSNENSLHFPIPKSFPEKIKKEIITIIYKLVRQRKKAGQINGLPDLFIPDFMLYIEMKRPNGKLSDEQIKIHNKLKALGYYVEVAYNAKEAWAIIDKHRNSIL